MAACDRHRYHLLGREGYHDNCTDNLAAALAELELEAPKTLSSLNFPMNIPSTLSGLLGFEPPRRNAVDRLVFGAKIDLLMAFSACPQDMLTIYGKRMRTVETHLQVQSKIFWPSRHWFT